ncbi:hypothetical protein BDY21DRAFT_157921 [Lineolata rhizophorae]|uniref:Heat shock protein 30 n=1 Tax=Lineolata rhizophorae TaxID=578093 RepID=A0A6A6NLL6_9PEZI|nr:hypothetical protein BDY21DRAFT_157921 [Lineolata rhizophorae]
MYLVKRNDALEINGFMVNGERADIHQTVEASDWYWTVTAIMGLSTIAFWFLRWVKSFNRLYTSSMAVATLIAAVAYFSMASNLGWVPIDVEWHRSDDEVSGNTRQIFYVRYIMWFLTLPIILSDVLLLGAVPWTAIVTNVIVSWVWIVSILIGTLVSSTYKWGYYTFGVVSLLAIFCTLFIDGFKGAKAVGSDVNRTFLISAATIYIVWICYPVAYGVCEYGNVISPASESAFYGVLDVLTIPVLGGFLAFATRNIELSRLGLNHTVAGHTTEKGHTTGATNGTNGVTNGTTPATEPAQTA